MHGKPLTDINEADLQDVVDAATPESLTLEFKRDLNLGQTEQKREVAKDVSALANAAGGRLIYGVAERELPDGSQAAGSLAPLSDGSAASRIADILHSTIHPRPRFDLRLVPVAGGHVLVVEVYSSDGLDLHMVTGYNENRFYKRGPTGVVLMTEPEVREAYIRIGELRASLEARVEQLARPELERRSKVDESILVIPLYSRANLIDPRQVRELGPRLHRALDRRALQVHILNLTLQSDGYRLVLGSGPEESRIYIAALKSGVVHYSCNFAFNDEGNEYRFWSWPAVRRILETLIFSHEVLKLGAYSGPVRILYQIHPTKSWRIDPHIPGWEEAIPEGVYRGEVPEVNLESRMGSWGLIIKDLLDPIFHATSDYECPQFNSEGVLLKDWAKDSSLYTPYLRVET